MTLHKKTSNPKISIIIPIYNGEKYLEECLDSVIKQTLKEIEIICVDDGSTDNSLKILNNYAQKDSRIKIINTKNVVTAYARKIGIQNSCGDYILFLDHDDWIKLDGLEILYNNVIFNNSDICFFDAYWVKCEDFSFSEMNNLSKCFDENINFDKFSFNYTQIKPHVLSRLFAPWYKLYSSKFLKSYSDFYFPKKMIYHDAPFHVQAILRAKKISWCPEKIYYYRIHPENTSSKIRSEEKDLFEGFEIIGAVEKILIKENKLDEFKIEFIEFTIRVLRLRLNLAGINNKEKYFLKMKEKLNKMNNTYQIDLIKLEHEKIFYDRVMKSGTYVEFSQYEKIELLENNINSLNIENKNLVHEKNKYKKLYIEIKSSNSWKMTKYFRKISNKLKPLK